MKNVLLCLIALFAMITGSRVSAEVISSTVFAKGDYNSTYYRIPAVVLNKDGNVVAISDQRHDSTKDLGYNTNIQLIARVSTDNGLTWGDPAYLAPSLSDCYGDAAVVYDPFIEQIVCIFAAKYNFGYSSSSAYGDFYVVKSADGVTWTDPVKITDQIAGSIPGYSGGFVASGRMLYVSEDITNTGYIYAVVDTKINNSGEYEVVICSKDHGDHWEVVNPNYKTSPVAGNGNESKLELLSDNSTMIMSIRTAGYRRFSTSEDNGVTWSTPKESTILDQGCNGDLMSFSYNAQTYLLQTVANTSGSTRKNVSIFYSSDDGENWTLGRVICADNSAYSALVKLSDGRVGVLVEEGDDSNGYNIVFYSMAMTDILPAQGISAEYDGSMVCNGDGYMVIPKSEAFNIDATHPLTVTARIVLNKFTIENDQDLGVLSTRWHELNTESTTSDETKEHVYDGQQGFEIIAGKNEDESIGANVSVKGDASGNYRGVLKNAYHSGIIPARIGHVAMVFDAGSGSESSVKLYIDGVLAEKQTISNNNSDITMNGATIDMLTDMLIGNRYEPADTCETTTSGWWIFTTTTYNWKHWMRASTNRIFNSNIDDVRFYAEALSEEDVNKDKQWGFPIRTKAEGLIAAYDFANMEQTSDGSAYIFNDISGNGHDGTTVTVRGYEFPEILHNINVYPVEPDPLQGTLKVTRFDGGEEILLPNGEVYKASLKQDFYATAEAADGWVLIGIYVNGVEVAQNGFFKAGADAVVEARFRREGADLDFYLVSTGSFNASDPLVRAYKFTYDEDEDIYTLYLEGGKLQGKFHVQRIISQSSDMMVSDLASLDDLVVLDLYSVLGINTQAETHLMHYNKEYELQNELTELSDYAQQIAQVTGSIDTPSAIDEDGEDTEYTNTEFSVHPNADENNGHYVEDPVITLVYRPDEGIRTLSITGGIFTGVENISVDNDTDEVEYFNLQGIRVYKPTKGIYITRKGNTVTKTTIK